MTPAISVIATAADASLAGLPTAERGLAVALGDAPAEPSPALRWLDRPPRPDDPAAERLIAPAGEGLWRLAPWPAADALFELPPPVGERAVVTGADAAARELIVRRAATDC